MQALSKGRSNIAPWKGGGWYGDLRISHVSRSVHRADYIRETIKEKTPPCVYQTLAGKSRL